MENTEQTEQKRGPGRPKMAAPGNPDVTREVMVLFHEGIPKAEIARRVGVTRQAVDYQIKRWSSWFRSL